MHLQFQNVSYDGGASRSSGLVGRKNPQLEQISLSKHLFFFFLNLPCFPRGNQEQNELRTGFAGYCLHNSKRIPWQTCLKCSSNPKTSDSNFCPSLPTPDKLPLWFWDMSKFNSCWPQKWFSVLAACLSHLNLLSVTTSPCFSTSWREAKAAHRSPFWLWTGWLLDVYCLCWFKTLPPTISTHLGWKMPPAHDNIQGFSYCLFTHESLKSKPFDDMVSVRTLLLQKRKEYGGALTLQQPWVYRKVRSVRQI